LKQTGVNSNCSAYIEESGVKFGILQTSMQGNGNVAEYVIVKSLCMPCNPNYVFVMSFCCLFYLNIQNLAIIVKTDGQVRVKERERIKKSSANQSTLLSIVDTSRVEAFCPHCCTVRKVSEPGTESCAFLIKGTGLSEKCAQNTRRRRVHI
jgi:hypothetical protein